MATGAAIRKMFPGVCTYNNIREAEPSEKEKPLLFPSWRTRERGGGYKLTCPGLVELSWALLTGDHDVCWASTLSDQTHPRPSHSRPCVLAWSLGQEVTETGQHFISADREAVQLRGQVRGQVRGQSLMLSSQSSRRPKSPSFLPFTVTLWHK